MVPEDTDITSTLPVASILSTSTRLSCSNTCKQSSTARAVLHITITSTPYLHVGKALLQEAPEWRNACSWADHDHGGGQVSRWLEEGGMPQVQRHPRLGQ
jgi:hypothetical protein